MSRASCICRPICANTSKRARWSSRAAMVVAYTTILAANTLNRSPGCDCASLGFASERLAKVAYEQMRSLGYYHLYRHRSIEPAIALAEELLKIAPVPMASVLFQCSGSEANDTAIKLAWYYWNAVGQPQRTKIIARQMAYHGNTCAAVSLSGKPDMHAGFGLPFAIFKH